MVGALEPHLLAPGEETRDQTGGKVRWVDSAWTLPGSWGMTVFSVPWVPLEGKGQSRAEMNACPGVLCLEHLLSVRKGPEGAAQATPESGRPGAKACGQGCW